VAGMAQGFQAPPVPSAALPGLNLVILPRNPREPPRSVSCSVLQLALDTIALPE
jgi:hypothetical protein